jgi:hypothetical protein
VSGTRDAPGYDNGRTRPVQRGNDDVDWGVLVAPFLAGHFEIARSMFPESLG